MKPEYGLLLILTAVIQSVSYGQDTAPRKMLIGDGVELHYIERGEGEPVVFVHGLTGDYSVWTSHLEAFAREGYRAIAYSRRYNHPNENRLRPNHSIAVEAEDLAAVIRELDLEKAHVVCHSRGAYTALYLALEQPKLVRTLTLAEPPIVSWLADLPGDQAQTGRSQLRKLITQGVNPARAAFEAGDDELALRTMLDCISGDGAFDRIPDHARARCRRNIKELRALVTSRNHPAVDRNRVRRLAVPTLILSGSESVATARLTDPELERLIPERSRRRVVLEGATHIMWVEQPEQSRRAVLALMKDES